jgi:hypothetical protein
MTQIECRHPCGCAVDQSLCDECGGSGFRKWFSFEDMCCGLDADHENECDKCGAKPTISNEAGDVLCRKCWRDRHTKTGCMAAVEIVS